MVNYKCQRCGYETINKTMLKRHILRKNICTPMIKEINKYDLFIFNEFFEEARKYLDNVKMCKKIPNYPQKTSSVCEDKSCRYCKKILSSYKNRWRHEKTCKAKIQLDEVAKLKDIIKEKDRILKEKDRMMEDTISEMKQHILELQKLVNETKSTTKINNGTINKTNNINKGTVNNFYVNDFGKENLDYITDKVVRKLLKKPGSALQNLIIKIHFNENHKENFNVKITNLNNPYGYIMQNNEWSIIKKKELIEKMLEDKIDILDIYINEGDELYKKKELIEDMSENNSKLLLDMIFNTLINNSKLVIDNGDDIEV